MFFLFSFLAVLFSMWNLGSLIWDGTYAPCIKTERFNHSDQGSPGSYFLMSIFSHGVLFPGFLLNSPCCQGTHQGNWRELRGTREYLCCSLLSVNFWTNDPDSSLSTTQSPEMPLLSGHSLCLFLYKKPKVLIKMTSHVVLWWLGLFKHQLKVLLSQFDCLQWKLVYHPLHCFSSVLISYLHSSKVWILPPFKIARGKTFKALFWTGR